MATNDNLPNATIMPTEKPIINIQNISISSGPSNTDKITITDDKSNNITNIPKDTTKDMATRCNFESCRTRLGLIPFDCKCGFKFCAMHRHSFDHDCTFDYKKDADELKKTLVEVKPIKIIKF